MPQEKREYIVKHERFVEQKLTVKPAGLFKKPRLFLNGNELPLRQDTVILPDDKGEQATIKFVYNIVDPVPKVKIDWQVVPVADRLTWKRYIWLGMTLVLVIVGGLQGWLTGVLGGLSGVIATFINVRIFRSDAPNILKYLRVGFTNVISIFLYYILAVSVMMWIEVMALR